ncbi:MAG TPA: hypothetical protein PKA10_10485 [Selenomonadales bacterium]|nr:hypothetical protein [Selenomonadales bacterium]
MHKLLVTRTLSTGLPVEKVDKLADEAGVTANHVETRFAGRGKWINDFEIIGAPGKVDGFFERVNEIRRD